MNTADPSCREIVDLVTAYLDGAMPAPDRAAFEEHLRVCEGCAEFLAQMRATIRTAGRISEESLSPEAREAFVSVFRRWRERGPR